MRLFTIVFILTVTLLGTANAQGKKDPQIKVFADSLAGKEMWLKITVIRIEDSYHSKDATNVYPNGEVKYIAAIQGAHPGVNTYDAWEFLDVAQLVYGDFGVKPHYTEHSDGYAWTFEPGDKVKIRKVKRGGDDIKVEIEGENGGRTAIRLQFANKKYTLEEVKRTVAYAFAENEEDVMADVALNLEKGMTTRQVIQIIGQPDNWINFETKSILIYGVIKLVFEDGKLIEVQ